MAAVALGTALLALPAGAQEKSDAEDNVFGLGTVWSVLVQETVKSPAERMETSVTKTEIDMFEKKTVGEALARTPGVRYARPSGGRYESGVYIRGFSAFGNGNSSVPLFIDGIPAYVPYDYSMDMGRFITTDVSTISVSKGYSSVLYGPNALGGAINVVSQRPNQPLYGNFVFGTGTGDVTEASGTIGTQQDKWYAMVNFSYLNRDFIHMSETFRGTDATGENKDTDRQNYGTRDKKVSFRFGYIPNDTDEYVVSYLQLTARKGAKRSSESCSAQNNPECWAPGYMETWWEWPSWDRETISYVSTTSFGSLYVKPRVYYDKYDNGLYGWGRSYATRDNETSIYDDYAWGGSLEIGTEKIENNILKGKFDYKFNQHQAYSITGHDGGHVAGKDEKLEEQVFFFALEDTYKISEHWEVQGGLLYSRRQTTYAGAGLNIEDLIGQYPGSDLTAKPSDIDSWDPQGVIFYKPNQNHALHYAISKKTRFPSIRNQYSNYGAGNIDSNSGLPLVTIPNPDLKPERALHHEIGWDARFMDRLTIELDWFYSQNDDAIDRSAIDTTNYPGFAVQQVVNVAGDTRRHGFDLGIEFTTTDRLLIGTAFSYLHSFNEDSPAWRSTQPPYNGSVYASIKLNEWAALVPALDYYASSRANPVVSTRYNQGTALMDLKLSITPPMHKNVSINVGAENLFNTDYRNWNSNYPTPGRYIYANVRYKL